MNEMDLLTKIEGLEKAIAEHKDFATTYEGTLKQTKQNMKNFNFSNNNVIFFAE